MQVASHRSCGWACTPPSELDWRVALDGAYGKREFFAPLLQGKEVQVVARTRCDRVLYRRATEANYCGKGRRPVFGAAFRCKDESIWGRPDETVGFADAQHGCVELQLWRGLGLRKAGRFVAVELLRSQSRAKQEKPPEARWYLAWNGKPEQTIGARAWSETITHRWGIEPANRFRKERLYAKLPKVRETESSDTGCWQGNCSSGNSTCAPRGYPESLALAKAASPG